MEEEAQEFSSPLQVTPSLLREKQAFYRTRSRSHAGDVLEVFKSYLHQLWMCLDYLRYCRTYFLSIRLLVGSHDEAQPRSELPSPCPLHLERNQMVRAAQEPADEYLDAVGPG
jgi:hypothetical protein